MAENNGTPDNVVSVDFGHRAVQGLGLSNEILKLKNEKKRSLFDEWLQKGTVSVLLDAEKPGVKVPLEFSKEKELILNFCYDFHVPDFNFNEVGVWGTLSFESGDHFCMVPWTSVFGLQSAVLAQGVAWFNDFSGEFANEEPAAKVAKDNIINFDFSGKGTV